MKRFLLLLGLLLLVSSHAQTNYYPTRVGMRWVYSNGEILEYSREDNFFGTRVLVLQHTLKDQLTGEDYIVSNANGVSFLGNKSGQQINRFTPPLVLYPKAPMKVGMKWQTTSEVGVGSGYKVTAATEIIGTAGVKVKAGRFNAFIIRSTFYQPDGSSSTSDIYFVPTIGTVRTVYDDGSSVDLISRK
jgi:hypothetical protein